MQPYSCNSPTEGGLAASHPLLSLFFISFPLLASLGAPTAFFGRSATCQLYLWLHFNCTLVELFLNLFYISNLYLIMSTNKSKPVHETSKHQGGASRARLRSDHPAAQSRTVQGGVSATREPGPQASAAVGALEEETASRQGHDATRRALQLQQLWETPAGATKPQAVPSLRAYQHLLRRVDSQRGRVEQRLEGAQREVAHLYKSLMESEGIQAGAAAAHAGPLA
jgi:hypothetical protein